MFSIFVFWWCSKQFENNVEFEYRWEKYTISTWNFSQTQKFVWYVEPIEKTIISTKIWWKIIELTWDKSDIVNWGQILWKLDNKENIVNVDSTNNLLMTTNFVYENTSKTFDSQISSLEDKLVQAKYNIEISKKKLDWINISIQDTKRLMENQMLISQKQIDQAKILMEEKQNQAKKNIEISENIIDWFTVWLSDKTLVSETQIQTSAKQVEQANLWVEMINSQISNTKNLLSQKKSDIFSNSKIAISNSKILTENIFSYIDEILWVSQSNKYKNDSYENFLSSKNTSLKIEAEKNFVKLQNDYLNLSSKIQQIQSYQDFEILDNEQKQTEIYDTLNQINVFLENLKDLCSIMYKVFDESVPSNSLTDQHLEESKSKVLNFQNNIDSTILSVEWNYILWIKWSIQSIENFDKEYNQQLEILNKQLEIAKNSYELAKKNYNQVTWISTWEINSLISQKQVAQKQFELAKNQFDEIEKLTQNQYENSIENANQQKLFYESKLNDLNIQKEIWEKQIEISKNQYDELLWQIELLKDQKQTNLSQIKTQLSQFEWEKKLAWVWIENWIITSPIDWVIVDKFSNLWEIVWPWTPIFSIADDKFLKVVFYVSQSNLIQIELWNQLKININWINQEFTWIITKISPESDKITKKLLVETNIINNWQIKIWMYANIELIWEEKYWILVPYKFIGYEYWNAFVKILDWNKIKKIKLENIECFENFCMISWAINIWDTIISY